MMTLLQVPAPFQEGSLMASPQDRQLMAGGISPGLFAHDGLLWADGENVVFKDGGVECMAGWARLFTVDASGDTAVNQMAQAYIGATRAQRVYLAATLNPSDPNVDAEFTSVLYCWQKRMGLARISSVNRLKPGRWSLVPYGAWLLAASKSDNIHVWKGSFTDMAVPLQGALDVGIKKAKIIKLFKGHIVVLNTNRDFAEVAWCSEDNIDDWEPLPDNSAGDLLVRDLESPIVAAQMLGDEMAIYSKDGMAIMSYLGTPFYFGINRVLDSIGAVSANAVVAVERKNYGLGQQGFWVTDGAQASYIGESAIRTFIRGDLNWSEADAVVAYHDEWEHQVIWYYPSGVGTENDKGVGFNYESGAWTKYDFGRRAVLPRAVFKYPLVADDYRVYMQGKGDKAGYEVLNSWVQTKPLDMSKPELFKRVQLVRLGLQQGGTGKKPRLNLGAQDALDDDVEWFYKGKAEHTNYIPDRETPYLTLKMHGYGSRWKLSSMRIGGTYAGAVI